MKKLSWEEVEKITDELAGKIKDSGFEPDFVVGIANGGLIPLYFLVKKLDYKKVFTITVSSYEKDKKGDVKILYLPQIDLSNKKVLLVDEIVETGDTFKTISEVLKKDYKVAEIKTVVLGINKEKCKIIPDFHVFEVQGEWVVFPWERHEFPEHFEELKVKQS